MSSINSLTQNNQIRFSAEQMSNHSESLQAFSPPIINKEDEYNKLMSQFTQKLETTKNCLFPSHFLMKRIFGDSDPSRIIEDALNNEAIKDDFFENLTCPLSFLSLKDPVLLSSGHTVSKESIQKLIANSTLSNKVPLNPFTRQPLEYKDDEVTQLLLSALEIKLSAYCPTSVEAKNKLKELKESYLVLNDPQRWCRLLTILMPPKKFYVKAKQGNHFIIEARMPVQYNKIQQSKEGARSFLRLSFFINENGNYQLFREKNKEYPTIERLLEDNNLKNFTFLDTTEKQEIEKYVNKQLFLENTEYNAKDQELRTNLLEILNHLEMGLDDRSIKELALKHPCKAFFRASILQASFPTFVLVYANSNGRIKKCKMSFSNGTCHDVNNVGYFKNQHGEFEVKKDGKNILISKLNVLDSDEKAILNEWSLSKDFLSQVKEGTIFYISQNLTSLSAYLKKFNIEIYKKTNQKFFHYIDLQRHRECPERFYLGLSSSADRRK